ncbi:reverse transcriptase domain-containing protein [Tanacetum coccineum]
MPNTRSGMTPKVIEELITQRVAEALANYEAYGNNENLIESGDKHDEETVMVTEVETIMEMEEETKTEMVTTMGMKIMVTKGAVGLARWFEKMELVFHISNWLPKYHMKYATCTLQNSVLTWWNSHKRTIGTDFAYAITWKALMKLMTKVYCPRNEIQKMGSELWNLTMKVNDLTAYTQRFQELILLCPKMVPEEEDQVERYIWSLPNNILENVTLFAPTRHQDAVRMANNLMDQKVHANAARQAGNKRKWENYSRNNYVQQQQPFKRPNVARAYTVGNNEKKAYAGTLPYCNKCKLRHSGPCTVKCGHFKKVGHSMRDCKTPAATTNQRAPAANQRPTVTCFECGRQGHYRSDCPKLKNQNRGNQDGNNEARGRAFALDVSYGVELAGGRVVGSDTILRGYTLNLLNHPFNIDLMPVEFGSFDVIIGMDWLSKYHVVIVYDENTVRIPYGDDVTTPF